MSLDKFNLLSLKLYLLLISFYRQTKYHHDHNTFLKNVFRFFVIHVGPEGIFRIYNEPQAFV